MGCDMEGGREGREGGWWVRRGTCMGIRGKKRQRRVKEGREGSRFE